MIGDVSRSDHHMPSTWLNCESALGGKQHLLNLIGAMQGARDEIWYRSAHTAVQVVINKTDGSTNQVWTQDGSAQKENQVDVECSPTIQSLASLNKELYRPAV